MTKISRLVDSHPTKYPNGYTLDDMKSLCKELSIDFNVFGEKLGVNTGMVIKGESVTYHCDVELAIRLCLENRDMTLLEWD